MRFVQVRLSLSMKAQQQKTTHLSNEQQCRHRQTCRFLFKETVWKKWLTGSLNSLQA
jgi:hypothetical protein